MALTEVQPKFGAPTADLEAYYSNGMVPYGEAFSEIDRQMRLAVRQVETSERTPLLSLLLEGDNMTGKTAIAAHYAVASGFPFVRFLSADAMIGKNEQSKCLHIQKLFIDAQKVLRGVVLMWEGRRVVRLPRARPRACEGVLGAQRAEARRGRALLLSHDHKRSPPPHLFLPRGLLSDAAAQSPLSLIILDDLERLIEYTPTGPRFSNMILQTLLVLLKRPPPPGHRLLVVGTTAVAHLLEDLQLVSIFNLQVRPPGSPPHPLLRGRTYLSPSQSRPCSGCSAASAAPTALFLFPC